MKSNLRAAMNDKLLVELLFVDGFSIQGFITKVGNESFNIVTLEPVLPKLTEENHASDEDGNIFVFQKPEDINYIAVMHSYLNDLVTGIVFDVSHRIDSETLKCLFFMRDNTIYRKKASTNNRKPRTQKETVNTSN